MSRPIDLPLNPRLPDDPADWPALRDAQWRAVERVPVSIDGRRVGSVAVADLPALAAWPQWVRVGAEGVRLELALDARDDALATMHRVLHAQGRIRAWRDEPFALLSRDGAEVLAVVERASARFWGSLTLGAHCNGWVAGRDGRPSGLWIARRSATKATDPGKLDNLVGGGVAFGQTPHEALVREGWEEAGLTPERMRPAREFARLLIERDVEEGRQVERLHAFDLELPRGLTPCNQDGEVQSVDCLPVGEAVALAAAGEMTVDAALVTLDFALHHRLLPDTLHGRLAAAMAPLRCAD